MVYALRKWDKASEFGDWLSEHRRQAGMTQEEVAKKAGCSKGYVSFLERAAASTITGKPMRPTEEMAEGFARALGRPIDEALLAAGYAPRNLIPYSGGAVTPGLEWPIPGRTTNDADDPRPLEVEHVTETRELHDDAREEYDRIYFAFEGEVGFSKLTPSEKDALVRRAMEESRRPRQPMDFRQAVEEAQRKREEEG